MTTENNHIDRLFKEKLGNFERKAPAGLLTRINDQMVSEHKSAKIRNLKTIAGVAAAVVLILMAGWFTLDRNDNQVVSHIVPLPVQEQQPAVNTTPEKQLPTGPSAALAGAGSQTQTEKSRLTASADKRTTSSPRAGNASRAGQKGVVPTTVPDTGAATAQAASQPGANQPEKNSVAEAPKKDPTPARKPDTYRQENNSWYNVNPGAAQTATAQDRSLKQWSLKAEIASTVTAMQHYSSANPDSRAANSIGGGMMASLRVSKKVTISSGIRFAQMKQGTHSTYTMTNTAGIIYLQPVEKSGNITRDVSLKLPAVSSIVYSNGMKTNPENTFVSDISQQFQYLEVPVQANYLLLDKKFTVGVTGGLSTNFLVGNKASITENGIKLSSGATSNLRDVIYAGSAGLELGYDLGKRMVLTLEPRVKQYLHSVSSNDLVNVKPLQFGIYTGISYSFE